MSHFNSLPEFNKEFRKLEKKYKSLTEDLKFLEKILAENPVGFGTNFAIIHSDQNCKIVKARLSCRSLRGRSLRVIYAYHEDCINFMYIEIYFKGNKENHDYERVEEYLRNVR